MPIYAQLSGDICVAVTQASGPLVGPELVELTEYDASVCGQRHMGDGVFEPVPVVLPRRITSLAFRRRFTRGERTAIEWSAVDRADQTEAQRLQAAELRADLKSQDQATYIDLDDPDTVDGVQALEEAGLIVAGRADEILSAPVRPEERP